MPTHPLGTTRRFGASRVALRTIAGGAPPSADGIHLPPGSLAMLFPVSAPILLWPLPPRAMGAADRAPTARALAAGEMAWVVPGAPLRIDAAEDSSALIVTLPAQAVSEYGDPGGFPTVRDSVLLAPVREFILALTRAEEAAPLSEYFIEKLIWEMAASLALETRGSAEQPKLPANVRDQAVAHIAAYRSDDTLTPAAIARSMNISLRQLQRAFAGAGTSLSAEIRRQRTALAVSLLTDPAFRALSVEQVAGHSGFHDAAELRRALRRHGHPSPRALRAPAG